MKVYLAARYSRREEMLGYKRDLEALGHSVTSEWLSGVHLIPDGTEEPQRSILRGHFASIDCKNVEQADWTISFTEEPRTATRGGRHFEMGAAWAFNQRLVNIGPVEHVFHCLSEVERYADWAAFLAHEEARS